MMTSTASTMSFPGSTGFGSATGSDPGPAEGTLDTDSDGTDGENTDGENTDGDGSLTTDGGPRWNVLFDGRLTSQWRMSTILDQPGQDDPGHFVVEDGALVAVPGTDLGLLWHTQPTPSDYELELEWARTDEADNSGVFVRFPDPESMDFNNSAWVAINFGFEVQIDETGAPDGAPVHTTGAIYGEPSQRRTPVPAAPVGEWNTYSIRVEAQLYTVVLNGSEVTTFENPYRDRGLWSTPDAPSFFGLQTHSGAVRFRNIRIRALGPAD